MTGPGSDRQRDAGQLYPVAKAILKPVFKFFWNMEIQGAENIPKSGHGILCPSHTAVIDSFFLPLAAGRRVTFVGKSEYLDDWKTKWLFPQMGMIPIDRTGGDAAERALSAAERVLNRGELFAIYPEGTRSRDGRLYKGHTGPARLAIRTGAPIVPVGIVGSAKIQPAGQSVPRPFRTVIIRFGRPIDPSRYTDRPNDHLAYRQLIDEVMFEIRELTGQEYVDTYATKKTEAQRSVPGATKDGAHRHGVEVASGGNGHRPKADTAEVDQHSASEGRSSADVLRRGSG